MSAIDPTAKGPWEPAIVDLQGRLTRLEERQERAREVEAKRDLEILSIQKDMGFIAETQKNILAGINKVLWAFGLSAISAVSVYVLSGGFLAP